MVHSESGVGASQSVTAATRRPNSAAARACIAIQSVAMVVLLFVVRACALGATGVPECGFPALPSYVPTLRGGGARPSLVRSFPAGALPLPLPRLASLPSCRVRPCARRAPVCERAKCRTSPRRVPGIPPARPRFRSRPGSLAPSARVLARAGEMSGVPRDRRGVSPARGRGRGRGRGRAAWA